MEDSHLYDTQAANRTLSSFVDSLAQHRENKAEPDSTEKYMFSKSRFKPDPNIPCQSVQTDKSVSSA